MLCAEGGIAQGHSHFSGDGIAYTPVLTGVRVRVQLIILPIELNVHSQTVGRGVVWQINYVGLYNCRVGRLICGLYLQDFS